MKQFAIVLLLCCLKLSGVWAQNFEWAHSGGNAKRNTSAFGLTTDIEGNSYYCGLYKDTFRTGSNIITTKNGGGFIVKYNPSGSLVWIRNISSDSGGSVWGIICDSFGNLNVLGGLGHTVHFSAKDSLTNPTPCLYLAQFDKAGNFRWAVPAGKGGTFRTLGLDRERSIYIGGTISSDSIFIAKHDSVGKLLWTQIIVGQNPSIRDLSVTPDGNVFATGWFNNKITIGSYSQTGIGSNDIFIIKIDSSGSVKWLKKAGGLKGDIGYGISAFPDGNFYLVGVIGDGAYFDGIGKVSTGKLGNSASFIAFFHKTGNAKWIKILGGDSAGVTAEGIAMHNQYAYVGGCYYGASTVFGKTHLIYKGGSAIFISKLDSLGNFLWSFGSGGNKVSSALCWTIKTDTAGNSFCSGQSSGNVNFGPVSISGYGIWDAFIVKISDVSLWRDKIVKKQYCAGDSILVPYHVSGIIGGSNTFRAEISDSNGSFDSISIPIGYIKTTKSGFIRCKLPSNLPYSSRYNIHVVADTPDVTSYYNPQTIEIFPYPQIKIKFDSLACYGQLDTLSASGGYTYKWKPAKGLSNPNIANPVFKADTTRTYTVVAYNPLGCADSAKITIKVSPRLKIKVSNDTLICPNTAVKLWAKGIGGNGNPIKFTWDHGLGNKDTVTVKPSISTTYHVQITDGCANISDSIKVRVFAPLKVTAGKDQGICPGFSNILHAKGSGGDSTQYFFQWDKGLGSGPIKSVKPGITTTYMVSLSSKGSCTMPPDSAFITVFKTGAVKIFGPKDTTLCHGQKYTISASATGGDSLRYIFHWDNGLGNGPAKTITATTTTTYAIIVTDSCSLHGDTAYVKVSVKPALEVSIAPVKIICKGQSATLQATAKGGVGDTSTYTFSWDNGLGTGPKKTVNPAQTTTYRCILSDICSAPDTGFVTVNVRPGLQINAGNDTLICHNNSLNLKATLSGGDSAKYDITWHPGGNKGANLTVSPTKDTILLAVLKDRCSKDSAWDSIKINVRTPLQIIMPKDTTVCMASRLLLKATASGGRPTYQYNWGQGLTQSDTFSCIIQKDTTINITLSDNCSPMVSKSINIKSLPLPEIKFNIKPDTGCAPLRTVFENKSTQNPGINYVLNLADSLPITLPDIKEFIHIYPKSGEYPINIQAINNTTGCTNFAANPIKTIIVRPRPVSSFSFQPLKLIMDNGAVQFLDNSLDAINWLWQFGDGDTTYNKKAEHNYRDTGTYQVMLTTWNQFGCADTIIKNIKILPALHIYFPNAFTPNGDNLNEIWQPIGEGIVTYHLQIFNRWGIQVFESTDSKNGWNGKFTNTEINIPEGEYIYIIHLTDHNDKEYFKTGNIYLMR